jgi:hypothetical protein
MVQLTGRDEAMLEWLQVVRFADSESVRWALAAVPGGQIVEPVHLRNAQRWISRMHDLQLIGRDRFSMNANFVLWASPSFTGRRTPNLFGQTIRHELAVAAASGRFLANGYRWTRDRRPTSLSDHQADGVALRGGEVELVEVELTPKMADRYRGIFRNHAERLTSGGISRVVYLCTEEAARMVLREADRHLFRDLRPRVVAVPAFDRHGAWTGPDDAPWAEHLMAPAPTLTEAAPELWREGIA